MAELTPLARKLRTAYHHLATTDRDDTKAWWNAVAETAEAELAAPRPVRLPTVEEAHQAIADRYEAVGGCITGNYWDWYASAVLDLVASLNPTWVPVPADATIPAGTLVRREFQDYAPRAQEWTAKEDRTPDMQQGGVYLVPSTTVLTTQLDPRIEAAARAIYAADQQDGDGQCWDTDTTSIRDIYVELAKAAADALGVTL